MLHEADYVLLANARTNKGFGLILDVAAGLPDIRFLALASQSDRSAAQDMVVGRGLQNVTVGERSDDMRPLYAGAKIVVVPSYKFIETFSRVCIEAHRFGKPVIGSDVGNVPLLLAESGIVLDESVSQWTAEIRRLFDDAAYYDQRSLQALENSRKYSEAQQARELGRIVEHSDGPILVGIGSGIGNMLHVGPMIRNLARRTGKRVDLVVAEDHADSLFLLHREDAVNAVYSLRPYVLSRRYECVFLTHNFGVARINFNADRVIWSRDWRTFQPGVTEHETVFNLNACKELLGVPYDDDDITGHYVANMSYHWPRGNLIGLHGGSKGGFWSSKRWGGYEDLTQTLIAQGFRVASFGTADEYVPGTEDLTGGSIDEMVTAMTDCSYFISNDSGLMNIANALGIPLIALFGPTDVDTRGPLGALSRTIVSENECVPCEVHNPKRFREGLCTCIETISTERVLQAFDQLHERLTSAAEVAA